MSSRGIMLRNVCDAICQDATLVDNTIAEQIKVVRQLLPKEKSVLLNETVSIPQLSWGNNRCKWR